MALQKQSVAEMVSAVAVEEKMLNDFTLTVEPGGIGGQPASGLSFGAVSNAAAVIDQPRSEEHTSELQSHHDLVCRLLLEKKKKNHSST